MASTFVDKSTYTMAIISVFISQQDGAIELLADRKPSLTIINACVASSDYSLTLAPLACYWQ